MGVDLRLQGIELRLQGCILQGNLALGRFAQAQQQVVEHLLQDKDILVPGQGDGLQRQLGGAVQHPVGGDVLDLLGQVADGERQPLGNDNDGNDADDEDHAADPEMLQEQLLQPRLVQHGVLGNIDVNAQGSAGEPDGKSL